MNLTELQQELRAIEERIAALHGEIEKMKPTPESKQKEDLAVVTKLAARHPVVLESILRAPRNIKKLIFSSMAYMLLAIDEDAYAGDGFLYICRLATGCKAELSAEDIYLLGLSFDRKDLDLLCSDLNDYKYTYLTEAFVAANISGAAPVETLGMIADVARLMGCDREEIQVCACMAKCRLADDMQLLDKMTMPQGIRWNNTFADYIPQDWLLKRRVKCCELCIEKYRFLFGSFFSELWDIRAKSTIEKEKLLEKTTPFEIVSQAPEGGFVQAGDTIMVYREDGSQKPNVEVKAPYGGMVCFLEQTVQSQDTGKTDKFVECYVISVFDDYKAFRQQHEQK